MCCTSMDVQQNVELRVTAGDKNTRDCFNILNLILSFDVLLTVRLIIILAINQLNAQILVL